MATKAANKRLTKEYVAMQREPPPFVWAAPDEKNILTWNYLVRGPPDSPFSGGEYHGVILFPPEYPFKPPGIKMLTPSGRFQPDKRICFSMSDFHPGSWNPAWSVATILTALLSFMLADEMTTGSVTTSDTEKRALAMRSHAWNITQKRFKDAFPEYCTPLPRDLPNMGEKERGKPAQPPQPPVIPIIVAPTPAQPLAQTVQPNPALSTAGVNDKMVSTGGGDPNAAKGAAGWAAGLRQLIWDKWRWGLLIALAVVVSRISTTG